MLLFQMCACSEGKICLKVEFASQRFTVSPFCYRLYVETFGKFEVYDWTSCCALCGTSGDFC